MFFTPIFIVFTLFLLANTQNTTSYITAMHMTNIYIGPRILTLTPIRPTTPPPTFMPVVAIPKTLDEYLASITTRSEFISAQHALTSAMPADVYSRFEKFGQSPFGSWPEVGGAPDWMSALPASQVSYISSFLTKEHSLMKGAAKGSAPTNKPRVEVVGAALAVGAAGLAML